MKGIKFDPDASAEFFSEIEYYEERRVGLGSSFREFVKTELENIAEMPFPFLFRVLHSPFRRCLVPKFPYSFVFPLFLSNATGILAFNCFFQILI